MHAEGRIVPCHTATTDSGSHTLNNTGHLSTPNTELRARGLSFSLPKPACMNTLRILAVHFALVMNVVFLTAQPGSLDLTFDPGTGPSEYPTEVLIQDDGKILIGGNFTTVNGASCNRIARLNADGTFDATFNVGSGFDADVHAMALQPDGKILVTGSFQSYNGQPASYLIRLDPNGTADPSFNVGTGPTFGAFSMQVLPDTRIMLFGGFFSYNGVTRIRSARILADGTLDATYDPGSANSANMSIGCSARQPDGKFIIAGEFSAYAGVPMPRIARINADGTLDATFVPASGVDFVGTAVAVATDGKILFSGQNGNPNFDAAFLWFESNGSLAAGFTAPVINGTAYDIAFQGDGNVLLTGVFDQYNGVPASRVVRILPNGSADPTFVATGGYNNAVFDSELDALDRLVSVGFFTTYDGIPRGRVARINTCSQTFYADVDGDTFGDAGSTLSASTQPIGYTTNDDDCDDTDPLITGPLQWWPDVDGDGWGASLKMTLDCIQPSGFVANNLDCNDNDPLIAPTEWCVDVDSDGHGDPNNTIWACEPPLGTVPLGALCDDCNDNDASIYPGAPCNDGNPATGNDTYLGDCSCVGLPCTNIQFEVTTDAQGADLEWQVYNNVQNSVCFGNDFSANASCQTESCCLPTGQYSVKLRLQNGASNFAGSYIIREAGNGRIVHNPDGFPGTSVKHGFDGLFSMNMGTDRLIESQCDGQGLTGSSFLIATSNPLVAAQVVPGNWNVQSPNTGYVFLIFNPDGGYDRIFFESLRSTNGVTGGQNARARRLRLNGVQVMDDPPPSGVLLNVRVANRINGVTSAFGPACRFIMNAPTAPIWPNHLVDLPGDALHSCGITTSFSTTSTTDRVYAVAIAGGANYRFQWTRVTGGPPTVVTITRSSGSTTNNRYMALSSQPSPTWMPNWTSPVQPQPGDVWSVRVAHQRFGQSQWSAYGPCCQITFAGGSAMAAQPATPVRHDAHLELWPNPNRDGELNLRLVGIGSDGGPVRLTLVDATGRMAQEQTLYLSEGGTGITTRLNGMAPGLYMVRASIGEHSFTQRLILE